MKEKKKALQKFLNGGIDNVVYHEIRDRIRGRNAAALTVISALTFLISGILLSASFFVESIAGNRPAYAGVAAGMLCICLTTRRVRHTHPEWILPLDYLFLVMAYLFGMTLGILQSEIPATTFCVGAEIIRF